MRISEFSQLLDDHGMLQSIRVMKDIRLRVFEVRKGSERRRRYSFQMQSDHAPLHKSPIYVSFALSKVSTLSMVNTLLIVTSAAFLALPGTVRPAFPRAGEKSRNPVTSRVQKLRGKDGSLVDEDKLAYG